MDHLMSDQNLADALLQDPTRKLAGGGADPYNTSLSQQLDRDGAAANADEAAGDQHRQQQQQEADEEQDESAQPELTPTVAEGLQSMEERRQQLHAMMDELAQVGLHFLDQQRQQFLNNINSFKEDVDGFCREEVAKGQQVSANTINAQARLGRAQLLVQTLGGAVCNPVLG